MNRRQWTVLGVIIALGVVLLFIEVVWLTSALDPRPGIWWR